MAAVLKISNLHKYYGDKEVLKGLDLTLEEGQMLALLGPNGAGKSTAIDIIGTLCDFSCGDVSVCGFARPRQDAKIRICLGIVFQTSVLDHRLSVQDNLRLRASLYHKAKHKSEILELMKVCGLKEQRYQPVGTLSGGERRKADIARALLASPKLLILDEPTTGLDPGARKQIWQLLTSIRNKHSLSILLTTHYIEEADYADQLAIIDQGQVKMHTTPDHLKTISQRDRLILYPHDEKALCRKLDMQRISYTCCGGNIVVRLLTCFQALSIIQTIQPYLRAYEVGKGTLEAAYLDVLGGQSICRSSHW